MPDALSAEAGFRYLVFDGLGSTNQECLERAKRGDPGGLWIRALSQTAGRGRVGRSWSSPLGNLYVSLLLVDPCQPRHAPQLGFVAGLALASAVRRLPGTLDGVRLKWPNDLVHEGAKLAGVLVEGTQGRDGRFACVLGFGVNCASHPSGLEYRTTDLWEVTGSAQSVDDLTRLLRAEVDEALALWDRGAGFSTIRERWLRLALPSGSPLVVRTGSSETMGRFRTIDDLGRLVVETTSGWLLVDAADVFAPSKTFSPRAEQGEHHECW